MAPKTDDPKQEALKLLETGIKGILDSQDWLKFLKFQSAFHEYSFNNTVLIYSQCPEATHVAGKRTWEKLNRTVKPDEAPIRILAPCPYEELDEKTGQKKKRVYFRLVSTFDVSQTEGEELPKLTHQLEGEEERGLFALGVEVSTERGVPVKVEKLRWNGVYFPALSSISVNEELSPLQRTKTLFHEMAHSILHSDLQRNHIRDDGELEAESVAFVVMNHFGLDSSDYSFGYVATWKGHQAIQKLKESGTRIQQAAKEIIKGIEAKLEARAAEDVASEAAEPAPRRQPIFI